MSNTSQFTLNSVGDTVFDRIKGKVGIIKSIDYKANTAIVKVTDSNEMLVSKMFNLQKVKAEVADDKKEEDMLELKIKYFNKESTRISKIEKGDWIDLRSAETIEMKKGEFKLIPLGVAMKLPDNHEAIIAPRGSTYKNFGIIETNSIGVVDNIYSGDDDQWFFPAYALRDTTINFDDRICQFRIQKRMPKLDIVEVEKMSGASRGGHGSTGVL